MFVCGCLVVNYVVVAIVVVCAFCCFLLLFLFGVGGGIFNEGAPLTFRSIFHKAYTLF